MSTTINRLTIGFGTLFPTSHRTQIDRLIHMTDVGFDEFTLTLIQSGLMIEELNHTDSCTERFIFSLDGLPPHTARCH